MFLAARACACMCVHADMCVDIEQTARGDRYLHTYTHVFIYAYVYIYTNLCRDDSAAVQRCVEVECPTRQVTQEDTACVCIITSARIYTSLPHLQAWHSRRATAASPPCPPGRFHWPRATLSAHSDPVKVHTLKRQCPIPSSLQLITWSQ